MARIRTCPFCNGTATVSNEGHGSYHLGCNNPECVVTPFILGNNIDDIVALWNHRPKDSPSGLYYDGTSFEALRQ